jgi:hypothetical protein
MIGRAAGSSVTSFTNHAIVWMECFSFYYRVWSLLVWWLKMTCDAWSGWLIRLWIGVLDWDPTRNYNLAYRQVYPYYPLSHSYSEWRSAATSPLIRSEVLNTTSLVAPLLTLHADSSSSGLANQSSWFGRLSSPENLTTDYSGQSLHQKSINPARVATLAAI